MHKDAERHTQEDRAKDELIKARNQAEGVLNNIEKQLDEPGNQMSDSTKTEIKEVIEWTRDMMKGFDLAAIKNALANLQSRLR
jgi:molecular chaperone DnaK